VVPDFFRCIATTDIYLSTEGYYENILRSSRLRSYKIRGKKVEKL